MNKVILMGRLTADPKRIETKSGTDMCTYTLAVRRDRSKETDFFNMIAFNQNAKFALEYFNKGRQILITGKLQNSIWEDKGIKKTKTDVVIESQEFTESKHSDRAVRPEEPPMDIYEKQAEEYGRKDNSDLIGFIPPIDDEDDLPF